jgi:hypothetical protein
MMTRQAIAPADRRRSDHDHDRIRAGALVRAHDRTLRRA